MQGRRQVHQGPCSSLQEASRNSSTPCSYPCPSRHSFLFKRLTFLQPLLFSFLFLATFFFQLLFLLLLLLRQFIVLGLKRVFLLKLERIPELVRWRRQVNG